MEIKIQNTLVSIKLFLIHYLIKRIADTLATLQNCEQEIFSSCTVPDLPRNQTLGSLDACKNSAEQFRSKFSTCAEIIENAKRCDCLDEITQIKNSDCNITLINEVYSVIQNSRSACIAGKN